MTAKERRARWFREQQTLLDRLERHRRERRGAKPGVLRRLLLRVRP
jgi:hypothetical protein